MSEAVQTAEHVLNHGDLVSLMRDVAALTQVLSVQIKGPATAPAMDAMDSDLPEALALLDAGQARGAQLRYVHEGQLYIDTLSPQQDGTFRLCRTATAVEGEAT